MNPSTESWNIPSLYKNAWNTIKQNPKLLLAGLAVTILTATSQSVSNSVSDIDLPSSEEPPTEQPSPQQNQQFKQWTDAAQTTGYRLVNSLAPAIRATPLPIYIFIAIQLVIATLIGLVLAFISSAWARGLLLHATHQAFDQQRVNLSQASSVSLSKLKTVIGLDFLPWLRIIVVLLISSVVGIVLAIATSIAPLVAIPILIGIGYSLIYGIRVAFALIWSYRAAIVHGHFYRTALEAGFTLSKGRRINMLIIGIINLVISSLASFILLLVVGGPTLVSGINVVSNPNLQTVATTAGIGLVSLIAAQPLFLALTTAVNTITYAIWHQLYIQITNPYETSS